MEPKPAPIWAIGPSFPADPPDPIVMAEAMVLITGTRFLTTPFFRWKLSIMASVPCPSASGAKVKTNRPAMSPPRAGIQNIIHRVRGCPRMFGRHVGRE